MANPSGSGLKYLPRHRNIGEITVTKLAVIALLVFATGTIITSGIHEIGIVISTALAGGTVIHSTISWFWGATNISGSLAPWQMFFVMESGTLLVLMALVIFALYPEPVFTNIVAVIFGFRNLIDGAPFLSGSDGFQAAKVAGLWGLAGAWIVYGLEFAVFIFVMTWSFGYRVDFRKGWSVKQATRKSGR